MVIHDVETLAAAILAQLIKTGHDADVAGTDTGVVILSASKDGAAYSVTIATDPVDF